MKIYCQPPAVKPAAFFTTKTIKITMRYRTVLSVPHGNIGKLAAFSGCSVKYASQCLQGAYNSEKADMVRNNAIKYFRAYEIKVPTYITK